MPFTPIPEHTPDAECLYLKAGCCYYCCYSCNSDTHICHFCGGYLDHNSYEYNVETKQKERHWLSDCRPDLVEDGPFTDGPMV